MAGVGFEQKHVNVLLYAEVIVRCKHRAHRHHIGEMESQLPFNSPIYVPVRPVLKH